MSLEETSEVSSKMAPTVADVFVCSSCNQRYLLFILTLVFILNVQYTYGTVSYSREALLEIGKVRRELTFSISDFSFLLRSYSTSTSRQGPAALASGEQTGQSGSRAREVGYMLG